MATTEQTLLAELVSFRLAFAQDGAAAPLAIGINNALSRIERSLMRRLRIAVLGEENSGKSLLINYLLKHQILPSGGFTGENTEILIRYAREPSVYSVHADGTRNRLTSRAFGRLVKPENDVKPSAPAMIYDALSKDSTQARAAADPSKLVFMAPSKADAPSRLIEVGLPLEVLKQVEIVEARAFPEGKPASPVSRAFKQVGLTIWCTLATQAWKETEAHAWRRIPRVYRRDALMLVTYKDAIRQAKDEVKITARLRHATAASFSEVALVSLRDAVQSFLCPDHEDAKRLRVESNIELAEKAINAMIHHWHAKRLQKAGQLLQKIAIKLGETGQERNVGASRELVIRLQHLAIAYLRASPSVSLSMQAA